jgi:hypothetical protein
MGGRDSRDDAARSNAHGNEAVCFSVVVAASWSNVWRSGYQRAKLTNAEALRGWDDYQVDQNESESFKAETFRSVYLQGWKDSASTNAPPSSTVIDGQIVALVGASAIKAPT